jgi:hypothetical protein
LDVFIKDWINDRLKGIISPIKKEKDMTIKIPKVDQEYVRVLFVNIQKWLAKKDA